MSQLAIEPARYQVSHQSSQPAIKPGRHRANHLSNISKQSGSESEPYLELLPAKVPRFHSDIKEKVSNLSTYQNISRQVAPNLLARPPVSHTFQASQAPSPLKSSLAGQTNQAVQAHHFLASQGSSKTFQASQVPNLLTSSHAGQVSQVSQAPNLPISSKAN